MDRLTKMRSIVEETIKDYVHKPYNGNVDNELLLDREHDRYSVVMQGWDGPRRVHATIIHLDIKDGKVWVQHDGTNRPIAEELASAGIPKSEIVLGFQPPDMRTFTGYAAG